MESSQYLQAPRSPTPHIYEPAHSLLEARSSAVDRISRPSSRTGSMRSRSPSPRPPSSRAPSPSQSVTPLPIINTAPPLAAIDDRRTPEPAEVLPVAASQVQSEKVEELPLWPCSPEDVCSWMYERKYVVPKANTGHHQIWHLEPMELNYCRSDAVAVESWEIIVHPEGRMYYQRSCKTVLTNSTLSDDENKMHAELAVIRIQEMLSKFDNTPDDTIIVIEVRPDDFKLAVFYYCISWAKRRVFWPQEVTIYTLSAHERPVYDLSHGGTKNDALFWLHAQMFTNGGVALPLIRELKDMLNSLYLDSIISDTSTVPYESEKVLNMIHAVNMTDIRDDVRGDDESNAYKVWMIARLWETFCKDRFLNYHGQRGAKLNADDALHEISNFRPRSLFFELLSPCLFWWPNVYLREVEQIWVDQTVRTIHWDRFITALREDWERSATPATVLLTANVSFLAIQSIDMGHGINARSAAQIASYASTMLSLANYITCQILLRQHRLMNRDSAVYAKDYFVRQEEEKLGLETLAIVFSLPHVLFVWSILSFLFGMCWGFLWQTNTSTQVVLGAVLGFILLLVSLVIYLGWNPPSPDELKHRRRSYSPLIKKLMCVPWKLDGRKPNFRFLSQVIRRRSLSKNVDVEMAACSPSSDGDSDITAVS